MKLVLASNNAGKLRELQAMLAPLGVELMAQSSLGVPEAAEPHCTFLENALAKARHASEYTGLPALADDAGLCVEAFGGLPGVDTAYYATQFGLPKGDANNIQVLLRELQGQADRHAALVSTIVAVRHAKDPQPLVASGRVAGLVMETPTGDGGFGFDPVLWIPEAGKTLAQMTADEKNAISHRGQASRQMMTLIQQQWLA